jgi:hypothetical protein
MSQPRSSIVSVLGRSGISCRGRTIVDRVHSELLPFAVHRPPSDLSFCCRAVHPTHFHLPLSSEYLQPLVVTAIIAVIAAAAAHIPFRLVVYVPHPLPITDRQPTQTLKPTKPRSQKITLHTTWSRPRPRSAVLGTACSTDLHTARLYIVQPSYAYLLYRLTRYRCVPVRVQYR